MVDFPQNGAKQHIKIKNPPGGIQSGYIRICPILSSPTTKKKL